VHPVTIAFDARRLLTTAVLVAALASSPFSAAKWQAEPNDKMQVAAQSAIERIKSKIPRSASYFEQAWGFAILPSVTRFGFGFGGAYGKGLVIEGDNLIGKTGFWQFTSGIQAGVRNFSMIVFFKDQAALEKFKARELQFLGQAGLAIATAGIAGTPAYNDGVAIITATRLGLMGEFTISGAKFTYKPFPQE
jgi:lipid-binding SYLF domain-containing protein